MSTDNVQMSWFFEPEQQAYHLKITGRLMSNLDLRAEVYLIFGFKEIYKIAVRSTGLDHAMAEFRKQFGIREMTLQTKIIEISIPREMAQQIFQHFEEHIMPLFGNPWENKG